MRKVIHDGFGRPVNFIGNGQWRDVIYWWDLTDKERDELDYVDTSEARDDWSGFRYRGSVYDIHEFAVSPAYLAALGYDGVQTESAFSAVIVRWFDEDGYSDDGVKVAYIHW